MERSKAAKPNSTQLRYKLFARKEALFWVRLTNQRLSEFTRQLLGLAAVLLPITASIIGIQSLEFTNLEKTLLVLGWFFIFTSVIAGCIQMLTDARYFLKLVRITSEREKLWDKVDASIEEIQAEIGALEDHPRASTHTPLIVQTLTIFGGLLLIMIVAASLLIAR